MTADRQQLVRHTVITGIVLLLIVAVFHSVDLGAQDQTQLRFKGVLDAFRDQSIQWQTSLTGHARWMFFSLATASLVWSMVGLALKGGDFGDFMSSFFREVARIGFMYILLVHSFDWSTSFVMGFRQAGEQAVGASAPGMSGGIDPAAVFQAGLVVAGSMFDQMSIWSGADNVGLVFCALVLICAFALLAGFMAVAIVESYIVIGGSVLLLGFGGASATADIAKRTLMYCVSVGAKLFVLQLIVGVAMGSVMTWANTYESDSSTSTLGLVGLTVLIVIMAKMIPETVQGMLAGSSFGGPGAMLSTVAAAAMAGAAVTAALKAQGPPAAPSGGGGGGGAGGGGQGGGAATASASLAGSGGRAPQGAFSESSMHMARAGSAIIDMGSGMNVGGALSSLAVGARPEPPSMPLGSSLPSGDESGGTISGAGAGSMPAPGEPAAPGQAVPGGSDRAASSGGGGAAAAVMAGVMGGAAAASVQGGSARPSSATSGGGGSAAGAASTASGALGSSASDAPESAPQGSSSAEPSTLDQRAGQGSRSPGDSASESGGSASVSSETIAGGQGAPIGAASDPQGIGRESGGDAQNDPSGPQPEPSVTTEDARSSAAFDPGRRRQQATRGAIIGAVVAGPAGAVIGAVAGAAAAPSLDALGAKASEALAAAKARFGLGKP